MIIKIKYDFHIHSCLSPCGGDNMTPDVIAGIAALNGLDVFALTDHNSALNCRATELAAKEYGVAFIPGVELTTAEDVHIICLFPSCSKAEEFSSHIYSVMPNIINKETIFGNQIISDFSGNSIGKVDKLLIISTGLSVYQAVKLVEKFDGFAYPAHIEKQSNGILPILGGLPIECNFNLVESKDINELMQNPIYAKEVLGKQIITSSDAHYPQDISMGENTIESDGVDFYSIKKALLNK